VVIAEEIPERTYLSTSAEIFRFKKAHDQQKEFGVGQAIGDFFILLWIGIREETPSMMFASTERSSS